MYRQHLLPLGERELLGLAAEVGWDELDAYATEWFDYSESLMVEAIRRLPSGSRTRISTHDPIPGTPAEGIPVKPAYGPGDLKGLDFLPALGRQIEVVGVRLQLLQIATILVSAVLLVALTWFLRSTRLGAESCFRMS